MWGMVALLFAGSCTTSGDSGAEATAETAEKRAESDENTSESAGDESGKSYHYSPFGVKLRRGEHFDLVSFKDVGLGRTDPEPNDPLLEAVAQSLSYELRLEDELDFDPRVIHDESLADPSQHTYCEANRLYVDIWRSEEPARWGYSLWSGCSESQKFAWDEVALPEPDAAVDERVETLARGIVDSIEQAERTDCFERSC